MKKVMERAFSLHQAEAQIDLFYSINNILTSEEKFGAPLSSTIITLDVSHSQLKIEGESENVGCGKGYDCEARVGAKFEAYEHFFSIHMLNKCQGLYDFDLIIQQNNIANLLPLKILRKGKNELISAIPFQGEHDIGQHDLIYPSFLINYRYAKQKDTRDDTDYSDARRYSCGTGIAAGCNYDEAAIHAISEVIERDAVGRFLARHFFYDLPCSISLVNTETFTENIRETVDDAQHILNDEIMLIDVTEHSGCSTYMAFCKNRRIEGVNIFGAGSSMYPQYAVLRAVKELVQQYNVADGKQEVQLIWRKALADSLSNPKLRRCLEANFAPYFLSKKIKSIPLTTSPDEITLSEQRIALLKLQSRVGKPVWLKTIHTCQTSGIQLVCAVMPRMERFSIAALGGKVVPCFSRESYQ